MTALEFAKQLAVEDATRLRAWLGRLAEESIVLTSGRTRGTEYRINPKVLRGANFKGPTTLKSIAPHRIRELVLADLATYAPHAGSAVAIADVHERIGAEIPRHKVKRALDALIASEDVVPIGERKQRRYALAPNGRAKP